MLWIALFLPDFALQLAERGDPEERAAVVVDGPRTRPWVLSCNAKARDCGVVPGMAVAAARPLAGELVVWERDPARESEALEGIACWAAQFTPAVSVEPCDGLLLEVAATLTLHGGLAALLAKLREGMNGLGYRASVGVAPTATAAWLFAKARQRGMAGRTCLTREALPAQLASLPLSLFNWPEATLRTLATLGIHTLDHCSALPRDGFVKRFGKAPREDLDRALGLIADPRPWFTPPEQFRRSLDFGFEVVTTAALLFPLQRLLTELQGFLRARGAGVLQWELVLLHSRSGASTLTIGASSPQRDASHLLSLAREHLARFTLPASVLGLRVVAERLHPFEATSESWLPDPVRSGEDWSRLVDRLVSRLGPERVYRLEPCDDHRPERTARKVAAAGSARQPKVPLLTAPRPLWLLATPRALLTDDDGPLAQGRLQLLAGPERLESGWWDGRPTSRDYYVARNPHGETFWVYREHKGREAWYLHGVFA